MSRTKWIEKGNKRRWAEFSAEENPRTQKSVHAWFFVNGECVNHYILQSRYIIENYDQEIGHRHTIGITKGKNRRKRKVHRMDCVLGVD